MRLLVAAASFALLSGCGSADQTRAARDEEATPELVDFSPAINVCPRFEGSLILPQSIPHAGAAFIAVRAVDPDADDLTLTFAWSATSGDFSAPERPVTEYRCADDGDQALTIVTRDASNCDRALHLDVTCLSE